MNNHSSSIMLLTNTDPTNRKIKAVSKGLTATSQTYSRLLLVWYLTNPKKIMTINSSIFFYNIVSRHTDKQTERRADTQTDQPTKQPTNTDENITFAWRRQRYEQANSPCRWSNFLGTYWNNFLGHIIWPIFNNSTSQRICCKIRQLRVAHAPGIPGTLAIPTCITARACGGCCDASRDR